MNYIGVDMSKLIFHAAIADKVVLEFTNNEKGYKQFIKQLKCEGITSKKACIGVESTGVYHLPFCSFVSQAGWPVKVINPLVVSKMSKTRLRPVKTDKVDAQIIRSVLMSGQGYLFNESVELSELKNLVMQRASLVSLRARLKQQTEAKIWREKLTGDIKPSSSFSRVFKAVSEEIEAIEQQIQEQETEEQRLLRSIPGIGLVCAAALVADVGNIERFPSTRQFIAYLGLDCRVHESGTSVHGKGYLTKRGNKRLRHLLFSAALVSKRYVPELGEYYEKKKSEGHHHFSALCATERKLANIVYAVWKRRTPFEQR